MNKVILLLIIFLSGCAKPINNTKTAMLIAPVSLSEVKKWEDRP